MNLRTLNLAPGELLPEVLRCIEGGGAVVTANARAARALRRSHAETQVKAGRSAWLTPAIHDWQGFHNVLWKQYLSRTPQPPLLLTPLQERLAWKRVAKLRPEEPESLAVLAMNAWMLLSDFLCHAERRRPWRGPAEVDADRFRQWAASFERDCRRNRWISRSDLSRLLAEAAAEAMLALPRELLLVGFDQMTPAMEEELAAFAKAGCASVSASVFAPAQTTTVVAATNPADELATCAWWARRKLEADAAARIAVIAQDIPGVRNDVERTFRRILMPSSMNIGSPAQSLFEFSLGKPLAGVPVVHSALLALRWMTGPIEQAALSWLLISGFFARDGDDPDAMALLDAEFREFARMPPEVTLDVFVRSRPQTLSATTGRFMDKLRSLQRRLAGERTAGQSRTFPEWVEFASSTLEELNWPGARVLDSIEYQALDRWKTLLADVAALGFEGSRVGHREFVTMLERYAIEAIFAPESHQAPVQIMGPLEASGQSFDALWFLGADERRWPRTASPNPLLPLTLQRERGMHHASPEAEWSFGLAVTRRLAGSGADCIFSYAERDDSGVVRPSALLSEALTGPGVTACASAQLHADLGVPDESPHTRRTLAFEDEPSVPWPRELPAGGAEILRNQSACAFRSFAVRRLGARKIDPPVRGIAPKDRGTILHKVLEAVWSGSAPEELRLQKLTDLLSARADGRVSAILRQHIRTVLREQAGTRDESAWSQEYLQIEEERLHSLLTQWLDYEAGRRPFTVEARERSFSTDLNGLKLNLRADRIDQVNGGRIIMDYKTSKVSPLLWEGERPEEPQLPLYGVYGEVQDLRGVLFAQIRARDMGFSGRVENAAAIVTDKTKGYGSLARKPLDEEALGAWADALNGLADQFLAGEAAVAPRDYPKTCKFCGLQALCRVSESLTSIDEEDAEDGELPLFGEIHADD